MPMTLEEQERRAYIEGRVGEATLLVLAIDGDDDRVAEAHHEGYEQGYDEGYDVGYADAEDAR